jgi:hypothetical protein
MTGDIGKGLGFVYFTGADNGTSLVEPLATRVLGKPAAHNWPLYERYDDPALGAIRSVERAAAESGADAARARLQAIGTDSATRPSLTATVELGTFFAARGMGQLAVEVLKGAVAKAPDSTDTHLALGLAFEWAGDLESGLESYRRARALEGPGGEADRHIQWLEQRRAARARPVSIPERKLASYAGRYQERSIALRDGRLYYRRGASPIASLIPMGTDLFELEANPMLRIHFVGDGKSAATKLVEISSDGSIDESARTN